METINYLVALLAGIVLRLGIPVLGTLLLIHLLRRLDERWQAQAQILSVQIPQPECSKIQRSLTGEQGDDVVRFPDLPCWQVRRLPNGYLHEECLSCEVFTDAPMPSFSIKPRRV